MLPVEPEVGLVILPLLSEKKQFDVCIVAHYRDAIQTFSVVLSRVEINFILKP